MLKLLRSIRLINTLAALLLLIGLQHYFNPAINLFQLLFNNEFTPLLLAVFFGLSGGYAFNNAIDKTSDEVNQKNKNIVETKQLYLIGLFGHLLSVLFIIWLPKPTIWSIIYLNIIILFYNLYFKRILIIGNLLIAFLSLIPFYLALQINVLESSFVIEQKIVFILLFAFVSFSGTFAREIIKDIEDIKGDTKVNMKTLPIVFSIPLAKGVATLFILFALIVFNSILYNHSDYNIDLTIAIIGFILTSSPLILSINALINNKINNPTLAQKLLKAGMFLSIIFLYFI